MYEEPDLVEMVLEEKSILVASSWTRLMEDDLNQVRSAKFDFGWISDESFGELGAVDRGVVFG